MQGCETRSEKFTEQNYFDFCLGARALWSLSESRHNKDIMRSSGIVSLMARLLKSNHIDIVVPIMGILSNCAAQVSITKSKRTFYLSCNIYFTLLGRLPTCYSN